MAIRIILIEALMFYSSSVQKINSNNNFICQKQCEKLLYNKRGSTTKRKIKRFADRELQKNIEFLFSHCNVQQLKFLSKNCLKTQDKFLRRPLYKSPLKVAV